MTTLDLQARGFRRHHNLPKAYTHCQSCNRYRWFGWWQGPDRLQIAACDTCWYLTPFEACIAAKCPIVRELHLVGVTGDED